MMTSLLIWITISVHFTFGASANFLVAGDTSKKCIPTDLAVGACHTCQCSAGGAYWCAETPGCRPEEPHFQRHKSNEFCEPGVLYQTVDQLCSCSEDGTWIASTCEKKFRQLLKQTASQESYSVTHSLLCVPGLLYLFGCNVCTCSKNGKIDPKYCTKRSCSVLSKNEKCSQKDIIRYHDELCACNEMGHLEDDICVKVKTAVIQRIDYKALSRILPVKEHWNRRLTYYVNNCDPAQIYKIDCNNCVCNPDGALSCTKNICFSRTLHENMNIEFHRSKRSLDTNARKSMDRTKNFMNLEELKSADSPCVAGRSYRVECNTCLCEKSGQLSCTTMICPDLNDDLTPAEKEVVEAHFSGRRATKHSLDGRAVATPCEPGQTYKVDCNTCHCNSQSHLMCTKMLCLSDGDIEVLKSRHNMNDSVSKVQPFRRSNEEVGSEDVDANFLALPELPNTAAECSPGSRYRVDCNTCSCLDNGDLICTRMMCLSQGDLALVDANEFSGQRCDKGDRIEKKCVKCKCGAGHTFDCEAIKDCHSANVPSRRSYMGQEIKTKLDPKVDSCVPGFKYKYDCNRCYCQTNGELRCTQMGCLSYREVKALEERRIYLEKHGD